MLNLKIIAEYYQRRVRVVASSGRERDNHLLTRKALEKSGHMDVFDELLLNEGSNSSAWKEYVGINFLNQGMNLLHLEDDLSPALSLARLDRVGRERVLVLLFSNISNSSWLLRWARVALPENVILVSGFKEAAEKFEEKLIQREI